MANSVITPILSEFIKKNVSGSVSANSSVDITFTNTGASILFIYARIPYNFKSIIQPVTLNNYYGYNWGTSIYSFNYGPSSSDIAITTSLFMAIST